MSPSHCCSHWEFSNNLEIVLFEKSFDPPNDMMNIWNSLTLPIRSLILTPWMGFHFGIHAKQLTRWEMCDNVFHFIKLTWHFILAFDITSNTIVFWLWFILIKKRDWIVINLGCFINISKANYINISMFLVFSHSSWIINCTTIFIQNMNVVQF
jgi:hypothetical protein